MLISDWWKKKEHKFRHNKRKKRKFDKKYKCRIVLISVIMACHLVRLGHFRYICNCFSDGGGNIFNDNFRQITATRANRTLDIILTNAPKCFKSIIKIPIKPAETNAIVLVKPSRNLFFHTRTKAGILYSRNYEYRIWAHIFCI